MINLLYCGNSKVFDGLLTSLLSILRHDPTHDVYHVFVFTMDVSRMNKDYTPIQDSMISFLDELVKKDNPESSVRKVDVTDYYEKELGHSRNEGIYTSPYTFLRLFADQVDGIPDKILYLDADILVLQDLHLLFDHNVEGYEYFGSRDQYGKFLVNPNYLNAGVLLLNLKEIKRTGLFDKARALLRKRKLVFGDQSAIIRCTTKRKMLPQRFNDQRRVHKNTVIRHFAKRLYWFPYPHTDNIKQWHIDKVHKILHYHQFDDILEEYQKLLQQYKEINHANR